MKEIIARCGYRCDMCLAYKADENNRKKFKDGLKEYYRYNLKLEYCYCEGCLEENENAVLMDKNCKIRLCVLKKGIENCAYCEKYPCSLLKKKLIDGQIVEKKYGKPIPEEEYICFIKPYENKILLNNIRKKKGLE